MLGRAFCVALEVQVEDMLTPETRRMKMPLITEEFEFVVPKNFRDANSG
jgi:hypothetical protein